MGSSGATVPYWFTAMIGGVSLLIGAVVTWNSQGMPGTIGQLGTFVLGAFGAGLLLLGTWLCYTGRRA